MLEIGSYKKIMNKKQELFDFLLSVLDQQGEVLEGNIHIIDLTDYMFEDEVMDIRVYILEDNIGYCFDIRKVVDEVDDTTGEPTAFEYEFYTEWSGFDRLTIEKAIELCKKHL